MSGEQEKLEMTEVDKNDLIKVNVESEQLEDKDMKELNEEIRLNWEQPVDFYTG